MQECDYWPALEFRLCGELQGMPEKWQRRYWCDGFEPDEYLIDEDSPRISGHVWLGVGSKDQVRWTFSLLLPKRYRTSEEIKWLSLLPPDNVTCWLALDPQRKHLEIEPAAAVPDLPNRPPAV